MQQRAQAAEEALEAEKKRTAAAEVAARQANEKCEAAIAEAATLRASVDRLQATREGDAGQIELLKAELDGDGRSSNSGSDSATIAALRAELTQMKAALQKAQEEARKQKALREETEKGRIQEAAHNRKVKSHKSKTGSVDAPEGATGLTYELSAEQQGAATRLQAVHRGKVHRSKSMPDLKKKKKQEGGVSAGVLGMTEAEHHEAAVKVQSLHRGKKTRKTGARRDFDILGDEDPEVSATAVIQAAAQSQITYGKGAALGPIELDAVGLTIDAFSSSVISRVISEGIRSAAGGMGQDEEDYDEDSLSVVVKLTYEETEDGDDLEARVWLSEA